MKQRSSHAHGRRSPQQKGFSIIETMIAAGVMATSLSALIMGAQASMKAAQHQRATIQAVAVAEHVTEELLVLYDTDSQLAVGSSFSRGFDQKGQVNGASTGYYTVRWVVSAHPTVADIRQLDISVEWKELGRVHSLGWKTYRR